MRNLIGVTILALFVGLYLLTGNFLATLPVGIIGWAFLCRSKPEPPTLNVRIRGRVRLHRWWMPW